MAMCDMLLVRDMLTERRALDKGEAFRQVLAARVGAALNNAGRAQVESLQGREKKALGAAHFSAAGNVTEQVKACDLLHMLGRTHGCPAPAGMQQGAAEASCTRHSCRRPIMYPFGSLALS